jgi:hypothetical protein
LGAFHEFYRKKYGEDRRSNQALEALQDEIGGHAKLNLWIFWLESEPNREQPQPWCDELASPQNSNELVKRNSF